MSLASRSGAALRRLSFASSSPSRPSPLYPLPQPCPLLLLPRNAPFPFLAQVATPRDWRPTSITGGAAIGTRCRGGDGSELAPIASSRDSDAGGAAGGARLEAAARAPGRRFWSSASSSTGGLAGGSHASERIA